MKRLLSTTNLKIYLTAALAVLLIALYTYGAMIQLHQVNLNMKAFDQSAYMRYARELRTSGYTFKGTRNRMPVYPLLMSRLYEPHLTDEQFFTRGKYFNIFLSILLLLALYIIFHRYFPRLQASVLILITAFTVFMFKAAYFQTELLFYFLNFCGFLLMWEMLVKPSRKLGIVTGAVLGIAHLTKASVLPGMVLFLGCAAAKELKGIYHREKGKNSAPLGIALVLIAFLVVVAPYIRDSKKIYGKYFYNVNSTFYVWYDSWEQAQQGTIAHGDRQGWPDMPPDEIPSLRKYVREHTATQMLDRVINGFKTLWLVSSSSYGYLKYLFIYLLAALGAVIFMLGDRRRVVALVSDNLFLMLFNCAYFAAYLLLYAWYTPIAAGNRLVLAQFLPLMFALFKGLEVITPARAGKLAVVHKIVLAIIAVDLYFIFTDRIFTVYGGS